MIQHTAELRNACDPPSRDLFEERPPAVICQYRLCGIVAGRAGDAATRMGAGATVV